MKRHHLLWVAALVPVVAYAQSDHAAVVVPDTTVERPADVGQRAHTNHLIMVRPNFTGTSPSGETPQSLRPIYNLPSTGGSGIIAIVDAFDYPTADNDLDVFSRQFGLPICDKANGCFHVIYANGSKPRSNCGWAQEAALDIEWAHAMAPNAQIVLVEAATNRFNDLFTAVDVASQYITNNGGKGEVSMSWGGSEFSSEASNDGHFLRNGIVFFSSSGDTGGVTEYPSASPNVVAAGGTSVNRDRSGNFVSETAWSGAGGGPSKYEVRPAYQSAIVSKVGSKRGIPDFSFDADPNTGVSVYDSTSCQGYSGWLVFGGTSVASPSLAGIVNLSGHFSSDSIAELNTIYANLGNASDFRDILSGTAGGYTASSGWDFITGVGSNQGTAGK